MKLSEILFLASMLIIACLLSFALMEAAGRLVSETFKIEQEIEQHEDLLHAFMHPVDIEVSIIGPAPEYISDGWHYSIDY